MCSGLESAEKLSVTPYTLNKAWKVRPGVTTREARELLSEKNRENREKETGWLLKGL